jgi:hypothetical protein
LRLRHPPFRSTTPPRSLEATFDLEGLTSDGGLVWLQKANDALYVRAGDIIYPPLGEWHWHGAAEDPFMTHHAIWDTPATGAESE